MMKRQIAAACALAAVLSQSAWAADYTFYGPEQGLFARPTSDDTIYVDKPKFPRPLAAPHRICPAAERP